MPAQVPPPGRTLISTLQPPLLHQTESSAPAALLPRESVHRSRVPYCLPLPWPYKLQAIRERKVFSGHSDGAAHTTILPASKHFPDSFIPRLSLPHSGYTQFLYQVCQNYPAGSPSGYPSARIRRTMSLDIRDLARQFPSPVWHPTCNRKGGRQQGLRSLEFEMFRRALRQRMPA